MEGFAHIYRLAQRALKVSGNEAVADVEGLVRLLEASGDVKSAGKLKAVLLTAARRSYTDKRAASSSRHAFTRLSSTNDSNSLESRYLDPPLPAPGSMPLLSPENLEAALAILKVYQSGGVENVVFVGPSGIGKTMTAAWLAARIGRPLFRLSFTKIFDSFLGKTARNLADSLREVTEMGGILFLDEMDAVFRSRDLGSDHGEMQRTVNVLLMEIDNAEGDLPIFAATNLYSQVDKAVFRRFHRTLHFSLPDRFLRERYIRDRLTVEPPPYLVPVLVELSNGFSFAHLENAVRQITEAMADPRPSWSRLLNALLQSSPPDRVEVIRHFITLQPRYQAAKLVEWGLETTVIASLFAVSDVRVSQWTGGMKGVAENDE